MTEGKRKLTGEVVSNKMDKGVVVKVTRQFKHKSFGKYITRWKKYMAHDEANDCNIGDRVVIIESRPLSRRKRWRVLEVVERAQ